MGVTRRPYGDWKRWGALLLGTDAIGEPAFRFCPGMEGLGGGGGARLPGRKAPDGWEIPF